jgi:DNA-binding response OmpR family regulator
MSGLELLKAVRGEKIFAQLPFIMITAEADRARVAEAIASGVTDLLVKPYTTAQLIDRIAKAMHWKSPGTQPIVPPPPASSQKAEVKYRPTILVVDDTPDNLHLLATLFKDEYRVRVADRGSKALEICCSDTPPDLVLLDVMMPEMDGFEVARRLCEHPNAEMIPVVFVTALNTDSARLKGLQLGAIDFVTKPIDPDVLKLRVRNLLRYVSLHKQLQANYDTMMELERLREYVEQMTRQDFKGPLTKIIELAEGTPATRTHPQPEQTEPMQVIASLALQLMHQVNVSSELHKIETHRFELKAQAVPIGDLLQNIVDTERNAFASKNVDVRLRINSAQEGKPVMALGDPTFCYSIFHNLVQNACEAAPSGTAVIVAVSDDDDALHILINNQGVIPNSIRERFFDKFVTHGKADGTGLGTYLAKRLVEAQNGSISMTTSDTDHLTTLHVHLPRASST